MVGSMGHIHADGTQEVGPNPIAEVVEENLKAASVSRDEISYIMRDGIVSQAANPRPPAKDDNLAPSAIRAPYPHCNICDGTGKDWRPERYEDGSIGRTVYGHPCECTTTELSTCKDEFKHK